MKHTNLYIVNVLIPSKTCVPGGLGKCVPAIWCAGMTLYITIKAKEYK